MKKKREEKNKRKKKRKEKELSFFPFFPRMTVVLCKELSSLSKEFTTCLTTAGVRIHDFYWANVCFVFRIALLRYSLHIMKFAHLSVRFNGF